MATQAFSSAGSTISISAGVPATYDAAGFGALSYTLIKEVTDIGAAGPVTAMVTHTPTNDPFTYKIKTIVDSGSLSLKGARVTADPGQTLLINAQVSYNPYSIKIVLQNSTILYFQALVLSYVTTVGTAGVITSFDSNVAISGAIVTV